MAAYAADFLTSWKSWYVEVFDSDRMRTLRFFDNCICWHDNVR